jgi:AcrR family transcriptional regulator
MLMRYISPMIDIAHTTAAGQRGPDSAKRDQIVAAAMDHFCLYGYGKTTVSDLAKAIGFSKAYIYKFFDSKQAIGEAICTSCLSAITDAVDEQLAHATSATDKFRRLFNVVVAKSTELFFEERKLYDIATHSCTENWDSSRAYLETISTILSGIILEGRETGEFERKTPLDETCRSIMHVMQPFMHPLMLQYNLDVLPDGPKEAANLVLRSLAP